MFRIVSMRLKLNFSNHNAFKIVLDGSDKLDVKAFETLVHLVGFECE